MLAQAFYRRDDFQKAAASLKGVDVSSNKLIAEQYPTLNVAMLDEFQGADALRTAWRRGEHRVKFVKTDPLPLVNVRVETAARKSPFFIDTGGSVGHARQRSSRRSLASRNSARVQGTFSGGQDVAEVQTGSDRVTATLGRSGRAGKTLPTAMLPLRQLSEGFGVKQIDGIIGTTLFYHFLATMDYPRGASCAPAERLPKAWKGLQNHPGKRVAVPIWLASDHFMVGWGRVETLPPHAPVRRHRPGGRGR